MSAERWAEKDARRTAHRFLQRLNTPPGFDEDELAYMRASAMQLLLGGHLSDRTAADLRWLLETLDRAWDAEEGAAR